MMYLCYPPALRDIFHTPMARFSLFVLKVPLNTKQLTKLFVYSVYVDEQLIGTTIVRHAVLFSLWLFRFSYSFL